MPLVGQCIAASVPEHVRMSLEGKLGFDPYPRRGGIGLRISRSLGSAYLNARGWGRAQPHWARPLKVTRGIAPSRISPRLLGNQADPFFCFFCRAVNVAQSLAIVA